MPRKEEERGIKKRGRKRGGKVERGGGIEQETKSEEGKKGAGRKGEKAEKEGGVRERRRVVKRGGEE